MSTPATGGGAAVRSEVVTTEVIQSLLDENSSMIVTILELQNQGKLQECSQLQARLQQNLMYLAAIADKTSGVVPSAAAAQR